MHGYATEEVDNPFGLDGSINPETSDNWFRSQSYGNDYSQSAPPKAMPGIHIDTTKGFIIYKGDTIDFLRVVKTTRVEGMQSKKDTIIPFTITKRN